jgi:hypothetical protein
MFLWMLLRGGLSGDSFVEKVRPQTVYALTKTNFSCSVCGCLYKKLTKNMSLTSAPGVCCVYDKLETAHVPASRDHSTCISCTLSVEVNDLDVLYTVVDKSTAEYIRKSVNDGRLEVLY